MTDPRRIYAIDETFFEKVDTEQKAYVLGFLYADGYNNERDGSFTLALKADDKHILEEIRDCFKSQHTVKVRTYKRDDEYGGPLKQCTSAYLEIASRKMSNDLAKLGCGKKKSDRIEFPTFIPKRLWRHFIRGFFDGDGGISKGTHKNSAFVTIIISNPTFIHQLRRVLEKQFSRPYFVAKLRCKTQTLMMGGNPISKQFLDWIYKDCSIRLDRKWKQYQILCNWKKRTVAKKVGLHDPKTGVLVRQFDSHRAAGEWLKVNPSNITDCLKGRSKTTCGYYVKGIQ